MLGPMLAITVNNPRHSLKR